jgi:tetratricopeptide (TPR) repeat protein
MLYDAFISYSHAKDKPIASALQATVQKLGKPWYKRRALRVFRDDTSLSATPQLWPSIERALGQSRFLILLASPEAAASPWVDKEVAFWLAHKSAETLFIALTDGALTWDGARDDFAWSESTPLPPALKGGFAAEPKWVNLTAYRDGANPRDAKFAELAADFAAAIHGVPKEDLLSQEVRQQRSALRLAWSAAGTLLVLLMAATTAGVLAYRAQQEAVAQRNRAVEAEQTATEQKQVAEQQRDRAEKTLAMATGTANSLVKDLAVEFRNRTGMPIELVGKILDRARALQRQLTESGEAMPDLRFSETSALIELAMTRLAMGDLKSALAAVNEAREIAERFVFEDPANEPWQRELSLVYGRLGLVLSDIEPAQALVAFNQSLAIRENLTAAHPDDDDAARSLAIAYGQVADALSPSQIDRALTLYRKGLAIFEQLAAKAPNLPGRQRDVLLALTRMGRAQEAAGRPREALDAYRRALSIAESLVASNQDDTQAKSDLSVVYVGLAQLLNGGGLNNEAIEMYL